MLDVNEPLRIAYVAALTGITYGGNAVDTYSPQLPSNVAPGIYIIVRVVNDGDDSIKTAFQHQALVSVSVYTNSLTYNDGAAVNDVASQVMAAIWPTTRSNITLPAGLKCTYTQKDSDSTQDFSIQNENVYIDRTITFRHFIFETAP